MSSKKCASRDTLHPSGIVWQQMAASSRIFEFEQVIRDVALEDLESGRVVSWIAPVSKSGHSLHTWVVRRIRLGADTRCIVFWHDVNRREPVDVRGIWTYKRVVKHLHKARAIVSADAVAEEFMGWVKSNQRSLRIFFGDDDVPEFLKDRTE